MNYKDRAKLQAKLKSFNDDEIRELKDFVLEKEYEECQAKKEEQQLKEWYV